MQVHSPIVALDGDMALALYGSALPLPDLASFGVPHGWTKHAHTRRVSPQGLQVAREREQEQRHEQLRYSSQDVDHRGRKERHEKHHQHGHRVPVLQHRVRFVQDQRAEIGDEQVLSSMHQRQS